MVSRWIPILFAFSDPNKPIIVERADLWDPMWQSRLNYFPSKDKYREFPEFRPGDKEGQLHRIAQPIALWLRHGSERLRVPINAFGWVLVDEIMRYRKISERQLLSILAHDHKGRYELAANLVSIGSRTVWLPWAVRATSGQSIPWLSHSAIYTKLDLTLCSYLPAMVHGTLHTNLSSILWGGLRPSRSFNMFNMIPHFDRRAGFGQRFDNWNSLIFYNPVRIAKGDPYSDELNADGTVAEPPSFDILLAGSGSLNVRGVIPSNFIDKIVIDVKWVAAFGERGGVETEYGSFPAARMPSADTAARSRTTSGSKGPSGSRSAGPQGQPPGRQARSPARRISQKMTIEEPDPEVPREEEEDEEDPGRLLLTYVEGKPNSLLTIYHHSYRGAAIVGWSGTKRDGLRPTRTGGSHRIWRLCLPVPGVWSTQRVRVIALPPLLRHLLQRRGSGQCRFPDCT